MSSFNKIIKRFRFKRRDVLFTLIGVFSTIIVGVFINTASDYIRVNFIEKTVYEYDLSDIKRVFPLSEGNYWVYEGKIEGVTAGSNREFVTKEFSDYAVKIKKVLDKKDFQIILVEKSYSLISLLDNNLKEKQYEAWFLVGGKIYFTKSSEIISNFFGESIEIKENLSSESSVSFQDSLEWEFPLYVGKKYKIISLFPIQKGELYAYNISEKKKIEISSWGTLEECYKRELLTLPDEGFEWFCRGIGIVESYYSHHGSPLTVEYKLKDFYLK